MYDNGGVNINASANMFLLLEKTTCVRELELELELVVVDIESNDEERLIANVAVATMDVSLEFGIVEIDNKCTKQFIKIDFLCCNL